MAGDEPIHSPARVAVFPRIAFWIVAIHLVIFGSLGFPFWINEVHIEFMLRFPPSSVGVAYAIARWLYMNTLWVWIALAASDLPSLWLAWRLIDGRPNRRIVLAHLSAVGGILAGHIAAMVYLAIVGYAQMLQHDIQPEAVVPFTVFDLILGIPAGLLLVGFILRPSPPQPGLCPTCGYDLRASKDRCPECGTPIPAKDVRCPP